MISFPFEASVIIPNWNGRHWMEICLSALMEQDYPDFEILVVDDASTDDSVAYIRDHFPSVRVHSRPEQGGFAKAANTGIRMAKGHYIILLNNDTRPSPSFVRTLVETMDRMPPRTGSLAASMVQMDHPSLLDDAGNILTWYTMALKRGHGLPAAGFCDEVEVMSACAGAALYRREFLEQTGGFDEKFVSYLEDIDMGIRGRLLGFTCMFVPRATVLHKGHGSGLPAARYIRFVTQNRLQVFGKNIPMSLIIRHWCQILLGQAGLFLQYRRPCDSCIGYLSFLCRLPHVVRDRKHILKKTRLTTKEIENLLESTPDGIPFPGWLRQRLEERE
jgi:GT2 family glycosyltransferase